MAYLYPYGDIQQLNLDWLIEQWNEVKSQIDGSLQAEIDRVEAAITDLLTARDEAVAAQTAAQASAQAAAGSASTASGAASTATAQAQAAAGSAATAGAHASDAQGYAATAQQAAQGANNSASAAAVSEGNARNSETAAAGSSSAAAGNALYAEGYAKGTQNGNPVSSGSPYYENNAKYYSDQAAQDASDAQAAATLLQPPATSADIGKALIVKTVGDGTVTSYELGESGGGGGGGTPSFINTIENVPVAYFVDGTGNVAKNIVIEIDPVQASGTPSPGSPLPITGHTGVNVFHTGGNLIPLTVPSNAFAGTFSTGSTSISSATNARCWCIYVGKHQDLIYQKKVNAPALIFTTAFADTLITDRTGAVIYDAINMASRNGAIINSGEHPYLVMCTANESYFAPSGNFDNYECMLHFGNTPIDYAPRKDIITIPYTFPTAAGTVYGGTLTINEDGSGILTVTDGYIASYNGETLPSTWISSMDVYQAETTPTSGAQVVYKLATPTTYNLTAQQTITILVGINNVWADTGNINLLQYYADSKGYIDEQDTLIKALIAKELPNMTADTALDANDFRIVNNTLYRITAPVASGGTLTPGTNCTATTITDILKSLL